MRSRWRGLPLLALAAVAAGSDAVPSDPMPEIDPTDGPERHVEPYNGRIRIGIIAAATSVKIGATVAYDVWEKSTDAYLVSGLANEQVTVTWSSGVAVATNNRRLHVVCTTSTTDRDQRVAAGIAAGFPSAWEHAPASRPRPQSQS